MTEPTIRSISCQELLALSSREPVDLIDVRSPEEYGKLHAAPAQNVPLDTLDPQAFMRSRFSRPEDPVYFICGGGGRSMKSCEAFVAAGFTNVVNVEGGTKAWVEAQLPVERGE
jgi:rhodanese-related sulfurtransferase